jgi:hypothetical protein
MTTPCKKNINTLSHAPIAGDQKDAILLKLSQRPHS